ncbi:MAG: DUF3792 domain-containing protein [Erysipelotrichaceae bacterium]|nr:DUF3792 domain-containing protein [Erysipelotrichaceae bacterium]
MKTNLKTILQSFALLFASTILFSLIFALLYYLNIINGNTFHILNWIFGAIAYVASGFILGYNINKKALIYAFVVTIFLGIIGFLIIESINVLSMLKLFSKLLCYLLGCIIAVSKKP